MAEPDEEATISIPSLVIVGVLLFLSYRWLIASRSSSSANSSSAPPRNGLRFTAEQVEQITQMFPQLNRRDVMWDLQRNGGSVPATTERVLMGRGLDAVCSLFESLRFVTT
jgi:coupling of ubiquitin conjugation to ER degradation protein 1